MTQASVDLDWAGERRLEEYLVDAITAVLGHANRRAPARAYCTGLLLPGDRKSVDPMAARLVPARVQATHQSLHHGVAKADWSDDAVLVVVRAHVLPAIERHGPSQEGPHSVGVARQYCGPVLRPSRQPGELSARRVALGRQPARQPADRLPALPA